MPVGASTTGLWDVVFVKRRKRVDFPVPALPVIKICFEEFSSSSSKILNSVDSLSGLKLILLDRFNKHAKHGQVIRISALIT